MLHIFRDGLNQTLRCPRSVQNIQWEPSHVLGMSAPGLGEDTFSPLKHKTNADVWVPRTYGNRVTE